MGVIANMIEQADHDGDRDPPPSHTTDMLDPFLSPINTAPIKLDDDTANKLLGIAVVISNIFS